MTYAFSSHALRELTSDEEDLVTGGGVAPTITNPSGSSTALSKVNSAVALLNSNWNSLTDVGRGSAMNITTIEVDNPSSGRDGWDPATGIFHMNTTEIANESVAYIADNIIHDGFHVSQYNTGVDIYSVQAEQDAVSMQLSNANALGLTSSEYNFLYNYMNDPTAIQNRQAEPTHYNNSSDTPSSDSPDPNDPYGFFDDDLGYTATNGDYSLDMQYFGYDYNYDYNYEYSSYDYGFYDYYSTIGSISSNQ